MRRPRSSCGARASHCPLSAARRCVSRRAGYRGVEALLWPAARLLAAADAVTSLPFAPLSAARGMSPWQQQRRQRQDRRPCGRSRATRMPTVPFVRGAPCFARGSTFTVHGFCTLASRSRSRKRSFSRWVRCSRQVSTGRPRTISLVPRTGMWNWVLSGRINSIGPNGVQFAQSPAALGPGGRCSPSPWTGSSHSCRTATSWLVTGRGRLTSSSRAPSGA